MAIEKRLTEESYEELRVKAVNGDEAAIQELSASPGIFLYYVFIDNIKYPIFWDIINYSAKKGHGDVVRLMLASGANVNICHKRIGTTPLIAAINEGHVDIVRLLLENGADANVGDIKGCPPIANAATRGYVDIVRLLLANGANVNVAYNYGWTPLCATAIMGHGDVVRLLLEKGAEVNVVSSSGMTPLYSAACKGHKEVAKLLLSKALELEKNNPEKHKGLALEMLGKINSKDKQKVFGKADDKEIIFDIYKEQNTVRIAEINEILIGQKNLGLPQELSFMILQNLIGLEVGVPEDARTKESLLVKQGILAEIVDEGSKNSPIIEWLDLAFCDKGESSEDHSSKKDKPSFNIEALDVLPLNQRNSRYL